MPPSMTSRDHNRAPQSQCRSPSHIPKPRHRVTNWREYDAALRQRGSLTVWFTDEAIAAWRADPRTTPEAADHGQLGAAVLAREIEPALINRPFEQIGRGLPRNWGSGCDGHWRTTVVGSLEALPEAGAD